MNFINNIVEFLGGVETLIAAIVSLVIAGIVAYKKIMGLLNDKQLFKVAAPLMGVAENAPLEIFHTLQDKPALCSINATNNIDKNSIVAQALIEKKPSLLKKMKLNDALQVGNWVSQAYQLVKPLIKSIKK